MPKRFPQPSALAAYAALFISLGGTGYAATTLSANSVGSRQIRNGSVQQRDLARGVLSKRNAKLAAAITDVVTDPASGLNITVSAKDGDPGPQGPQGDLGPASAVPGPQGDKGPTGVQGDQGIPGGSFAYGRVAANGTLTDSSALIVTHPSTGIYCVNVNNVATHVATATPEADGSTTRAAFVLATPSSGPCNGSDFQVSTQSDNTTLADVPYYLMVN